MSEIREWNENSYAYELIDVDPVSSIHFEYSVDPGSYVAMHWHPAVEIISILKGEPTVETDQQRYDLKAGSCILINAATPHSTTTIHGNTAILVQLPQAFLETWIPDIRERQFIWDPLTQNPREITKIERVKEVLKQMLIVSDIHPDGYALRFQSLLFELLFELYHNFSRQISGVSVRSQKKLSRLQAVFLYTEQHYREQISLDEIASELHLQRNYFCRFFREQTGTTYLRYLNEYRLSMIYHDLVTTDLPVSTLLEHHGFQNYKLFRTMFRDRFHMTPGQVRAERSSRSSRGRS